MTTEQQMINISPEGEGAVYLDPEAWLWCLHCERFFQAKDLKPDRYKGHQNCAFDRCNGSGYKIDIFDWDAWATSGSKRIPHWPSDVSELEKGMKCSISQ